jgi:penicillin-binding protein 1A
MVKKNKKQLSEAELKVQRKKRIIIGSVSAVLLFIIFILWGLPSLEELENPKPILASKVVGIDGEVIGTYFVENRIEAKIDSIPNHLKQALIATEDRDFYDHWGVDLPRFCKAMVKNVFFFSREGASTITQQLAKNLYQLKGKDENLLGTGIRKIREWITAIQIEKTYTKNEILGLYLNVSYFGRGAYGIETAANTYFSKSAKDLTVSESALMVALLKSSVNYDPVRRHDASIRRRNQVMKNMVEAGFISEEKYESLKNEEITIKWKKRSASYGIAAHFLEYLRPQLQKIAEKHGVDLFRGGLTIYTTIDSRMQKAANKAVTDHLAEYQPMFEKNWKWSEHQDVLDAALDRAIKDNALYRNAGSDERKSVYSSLKSNTSFVDSVKKVEQTIEVGFVAIDPTNGQIRAMVGGQNMSYGTALNHASGIRRQPGSSFKPIIYTAAINNGMYPAYPILNQPFTSNGWSPKNSDGSTGGYTMLRTALKNSLNLVTARLIYEGHVSLSQVGETARKMGITSKLDLVPSIALGTSEVSPLELTSAYATLANKGIYTAPMGVLRIEDKDGITLEKFYPDKVSEGISAETASIMTSMMTSVVDGGTGGGVRRWFHRPAAGKTGTTQSYGDAWFVGFTPQLAAGVWVGFDDRRVAFTGWYGQGAKAAAPIWGRFMDEVYRNVEMPLKYFELAPGVKYANFCSESIYGGHPKLANEGCPDIISDIINPSNMPEHCAIHGKGGEGASSVNPF